MARRHLVAQHAHGFRARADEDHAGGGARCGELRILGQEAIARMNRVDPASRATRRMSGNVEVGFDRALALAHQVGFVRLGAMQC